MAQQYKQQIFTGKTGNEIYYMRNGKLCKRSCAQHYRLSKESKKSSSEFGRASRLSAKLRKILQPHLLPSFDHMLHSRMTGSFRRVILSGPTALKGKRDITDGNINLLNGLELNEHTRFDRLMKTQCIIYIADNTVTIAIPPIHPVTHIQMPGRAECAVLNIVCCSVAFDDDDDEAFCVDDITIKNDEAYEGTELSFYLPEKKRQLVVVVLNIYFVGKYGNESFRIDDKRYQAGVLADAAVRLL